MMTIRWFRLLVLICMIWSAVTSQVLAMAWTDTLPEERDQTLWYEEELQWPAGTVNLVNDELRTAGWHFFFSECANDVYSYGMQCRNAEDANHLIDLLAWIDSEKLTVALSPGREHGIPLDGDDGPRFPVTFAIGSQKISDEWFQRLPFDGGSTTRRVWGVHRYDETPVVLPPTLTIHLASGLMKLEELKIPDYVQVVPMMSEYYRKTHPDDVLIKQIDRYVADRQRQYPSTQPSIQTTTRPAIQIP